MPTEHVEKKMYTLNDIAKELGVNKATVSKAISGKGNLSAQTRARILAFIDQCGYRPNAVAQSLAKNQTYNIGLMMPDYVGVLDEAFFRECLRGVCKIASNNGYDVLMVMDSEKPVEHIARLIDNRKIDGVIAMRSLVDSPVVGFLKEKQVPFVIIGPTSDTSVLSVDNDNRGACRDLTSLLITRGIRKMALIGGEGEGLDRFYSSIEGSQSGIERREIFIDAQSISQKYEDDHGEEQTYTDAEYKAMLDSRGKLQLAQMIQVDAFSGTINTSFGNWLLNRDYSLGDIVTMQNNQIGIYANVRITETTEVQDESGYTVSLNYE